MVNNLTNVGAFWSYPLVNDAFFNKRLIKSMLLTYWPVTVNTNKLIRLQARWLLLLQVLYSKVTSNYIHPGIQYLSHLPIRDGPIWHSTYSRMVIELHVKHLESVTLTCLGDVGPACMTNADGHVLPRVSLGSATSWRICAMIAGGPSHNG